MKKLCKALFIFVAALFVTTNVNAMSKAELEAKLTKVYTINGVEFKLTAGNINKVKTYLEQNEISDADCTYIAEQVDKVIAIIDESNVTSLDKLPKSSKNEIIELVNKVGANTEVPVRFENGKLFVGEVANPTKPYFYDDINLKTDVKYTGASLCVTIALVVAAAGITAIVAKTKKENA